MWKEEDLIISFLSGLMLMTVVVILSLKLIVGSDTRVMCHALEQDYSYSMVYIQESDTCMLETEDGIVEFELVPLGEK